MITDAKIFNQNKKIGGVDVLHLAVLRTSGGVLSARIEPTSAMCIARLSLSSPIKKNISELRSIIHQMDHGQIRLVS